MTNMPKIDINLLKEDLYAAELVFTWNKRFFTLFGVNPLKFNNLLYSAVCLYAVMHLIMGCVDISENFENINYMIDAVMELGAITTVLTKFILYRLKQQSLANLLIEIKRDYSIDKYNNEKEVCLFLDYVLKAKTFFKVCVPLSFATAILYYLRTFITGGGIGIPVKIDSANVTWFLLPYRVHFYYPVTSIKVYVSALLYLLPIIPIAAFTLMSDASLMLSLLAHVCGRLSVLSRSVIERFADDAATFNRDVAKAVVEHHRLIGMAKSINSVFNLSMLQQLLGLTFFLCFAGYSMLRNWDQNENGLLVTFLVMTSGMVFLLFAYCYAGQSLVDESVYLCDALYNTTWYKLEPLDLKYYLIFMKRAQTPLVVTAGRFYVFLLSSFLSVVKSAAAYLSVLRTLI